MNPFKVINVIFFLLFFAYSSSCKNQSLPHETLLISLEKTPCFGTCEAYKLEIFSSGLVKFNGLGNHKMIGHYEARIEQQELRDIMEQFRVSDFFSFKDQYAGNVKDLPTTYIFFKDQMKEKTIQDYYNAPMKLKELEQLIEGLVLSLKWRKTN